MARSIKINISGTPTTVAKIYINISGSAVKVKKGYINISGTPVQFYGSGPFVDLDPEFTITQATTTTPKEYSRLNKPTLTGKTYYIYNAISAEGWFEFSDTKTDSVAGTTFIKNYVSGSSKFNTHNITLPASTNPNISSGYFTSSGFVWDQDDYPFNTTPSYFRYVVEAIDNEDNVNTFISTEKPIISKPMVDSGSLTIKKTSTNLYDYDDITYPLFTTEDSITGYSYEWTIRSSTSVTSSANILAGTTVSGTITGAISNIPQYNISTYANDKYGKYVVLRVWATNPAGTDLTEYFNAASDMILAPVGTVTYSGTGFNQGIAKISYTGTYTVTLNNDWYVPSGTTYVYSWYRTDGIAGGADVAVQVSAPTTATSSSLTIGSSNGIFGEFYYCMIETNTSGFLETIKAQLVPAAPTVIFQSNTNDGAKNFYVTIGNGASYPGYEAGKNITWVASWSSTGDNGTLSGTIPYPTNGTKPTYTQTYPLYVTATGAIPNWTGSNSVSITGVTSTLVTTGLNPTTVSSWETGSGQGTIWFPYVGTVSVSGGNTAITQKRISKGSSLVVSTSGGTTVSPGGATVVYTYQWYELNDSSTVVYTGATFTPNESSYMGKQYRCKVTATLGSLTDVAYTDYYMVVPGAPSYTLSQNGQGSFSTSTIVSNGATHYNGTYTYGSTTSTVGTTPIASSIGPVIVGKTTVSMTLYGQYYNGSIYIDGYATTTQSISVLAAPSAATPSPEISRQQDYNYVYTTTNGNWLYNPTSYSYAWKYSTDGGVSFTTIAQTTQTITLDSSYIGRKLYCTVTATNSDGSGSTTTSNVMAFLVTGAYPAPFSITSIVDGTQTPVTPSSVVISSNSSNVGTLTWTSLLTSVDSFNWVLSGTPFASSGSIAAVAGQGTYTYGNWTFGSSGNESASVTAVNNSTRVDVNWETSTNATSYNLTYTTSGGQTTVNGITNTYYPVSVASGTGLIVNSLKAVNTYLPTGRATTTSVPTTSVNAVPKSGTAATATALLLLYPQNSVAPVISRTSIDGYQYTCTTGTWTATESVTYSYQWLLGGSPITSSGQSSTLNASVGYVGQNLTCIVTATNSNTRSNSSTSAAVAVTVARPGPFTYSLSPAATTPGTPTGLSLSSNTLNLATLSWTSGGGSTDYSYVLSGTPFNETSSTTNGNTSITFTIVGSGTETASVAGKTGSQGVNITWGASSDASTYTLSYTDNTGTVHNVPSFSAAGTYTIPYATVTAITLTATNTSGSRTATTSNTFPYVTGTITGASATTSATLLLYPQNSVIPSISRNALYSYAYTCSTGTWTATSGVSYAYQWYVNGNAQGVNNGGTTATIGLDASNIGGSIYCVVTATNTNGGSKTAQTNGLTVTGATPQPFTFSLSDSTPIPPVPVISTMTSNSSNVITLNWGASTNASDYEYYFTGSSTSSSTTTLGALSGTGTLTSTGSVTGYVRAKRGQTGVQVNWTTSTYATSYTVNYTAGGTTYNQTGLTGNSWNTGFANVTVNSVTAVNSYGSTGSSSSAQSGSSATQYSTSYASITQTLYLYPQNTVTPSISQTAGTYNLTTTNGTWSNTSSVTYSYYWYVAAGTNAGTALGTTQTITVPKAYGELTSMIVCTVTATNGGTNGVGSNSSTSAGWSVIPYYTVTWDANGGTVSPSSNTQQTYGGSVPVPTEPVRSGYTWNGWFSAATGGTRIIQTQTSYTPTSDITLYSQWIALTAPSAPPNVSGTDNLYPSGGTFSWNSSTGSAPITYYYQIIRQFVGVATSGSTTSNSVTYTGTGTFYISLYASNAAGTSSTVSSSPVTFTDKTAVPTTPTNLSNSYSSGPTWTGTWSSSGGTGPITYYWTLYQSLTNGGSVTTTASGSTTGNTFTRSMSSSNGLWAYFDVFAVNSNGSSGVAVSGWA